MYDVVFEKAKGYGVTVNRRSAYAEAAVRGFFKKDVMRNLWCFLVDFAKLVRSPFLQNSTGRLLRNIAVPIIAQGELYW